MKDSTLHADSVKPIVKSESADEDQVDHWAGENIEKPKDVKIVEEAVKPEDEMEPREPTPMLPTRKLYLIFIHLQAYTYLLYKM